MGLFNKKKLAREAEEQRREMLAELAKLPCQRKGGKHFWRDFPAYVEYCTGRNGYVVIKEPYCCIWCGKREDRPLEHLNYTNLSVKEALAQKERFQKEYPDLIRPRAIVEDMVEDAQHVDRQKLAIWEQMHAPENTKKDEPFELTLGSPLVLKQ